MDALFKRYGHPFPFMDGMIQAGRFCFFVRSFWEEIHREKNEKTLWDFYLHKVLEGSFDDFKKKAENDEQHRSMSDHDVEAILKHTNSILNNFAPEGGEA